MLIVTLSIDTKTHVTIIYALVHHTLGQWNR